MILYVKAITIDHNISARFHELALFRCTSIFVAQSFSTMVIRNQLYMRILLEFRCEKIKLRSSEFVVRLKAINKWI